MKEFLNKNKVGFTISPNDASALAELLVYLSTNKAIVERYGHRAKSLAKKLFNKDVLATKMLIAIKKVYEA